jgi:Lar family restriction alleviation protein
MDNNNPPQPAGVAGVPELKPCPFCGSENVTVSNGYDEDGNWVALCGECKSSGTFCVEKAKAIDAWNTRATQPATTPSSDDWHSVCTFRLVAGDRVYSPRTGTWCELMDDCRVIVKETSTPTPPDVAERARRAAELIQRRYLPDHRSADGFSATRREIADIIAAEFK